MGAKIFILLEGYHLSNSESNENAILIILSILDSHFALYVSLSFSIELDITNLKIDLE